MASSGSLAQGLPRGPRGASRRAFLAPLWAFLAGPRYDAELADGISPMASIRHAARAGWIARRGSCRRVSRALRRALEAAKQAQDGNCLDSKAPVDADAVRASRVGLLSLADTLATIEHPPARGVAIARQLVFDGRSPLFLQAPEHRADSERRLANSVQAAQRALEVSADLDSMEWG